MERETFPADIEVAATKAAGEWFRAIGSEEHHFADAIARAILADRDAANRAAAVAPELLEALTLCQRALAALVAPEAIKNTTVSHAFAQATEAECKARAALSKAEAR